LIEKEVTQVLSSASSGYTATVVSNKLKTQKRDPRKDNKILYEYHFKTSKYNSLKEKLQAMKFKKKARGVERSDLAHPKMEKTYSLPVSAKETEDYYLFTSDEGFDAFDQERLRKNMYMNHNDDANLHPFEVPLYYARHNKYPDWSNWAYAKAYTKSSKYSFWKHMKIGNDWLQHSWQLEQITDYMFQKYWKEDNYATKVMFPNYIKDKLSDWEIKNNRLSINVRCTSCHTNGYSGSGQWEMSVTIARRRIMQNQWALMNFIGDQGYKNKILGGYTTTFLHYMVNLDFSTTGKLFAKPSEIYHQHWGKNYLNSSSNYYKLYEDGMQRARRRLDGMKFHINFVEPYYNWKNMNEKAYRSGRGFKIELEDGF
jgi:hypothetical protein